MTGVLRRWLRPWTRQVRDWRDFRARRAPVTVGATLRDGRVDVLTVTPDGVVSALGWADDLGAFERAVALRLAGVERPPTHAFRVPRPDVEGVAGAPAGFRGVVAEWILDACPSSRQVTLIVEGRATVSVGVPKLDPIPYAHLHTHAAVSSRGEIYGHGPPSRVVSEEVLYLARRLPPPVLDFGCGAGALVAALRREGREAYGLELDVDRIREHLLPDAAPFVTLYDGTLPAPFPDGHVASVACSEVLEHMPHPQAAVAEMARLATTAVFVTVPDMSAIARGYPHGVVPWHLLESTHLNFFTQPSLRALLAAHAAHVEMSRLGLVVCDRMQFYTSLAAVARRGRPAGPSGQADNPVE
jgi:SAM-dependent methyltransferase